MPNPWFRMYSEFEDDPKVLMLPDAMQTRLVFLMCERCKQEKRTEAQRAFKWRISLQELQATKAAFIDAGFIDSEWNLLNWNKRQFISDSSTDRVRKHRANVELKQDETLQKRPVTVTVTAPDTDTDTEAEQKTPKTTPKASPSAFVLPEWIHKDAWSGFEEMRKKIRAPLTDRARNGIVKELQKLCPMGNDAAEILDQSTRNSWRGVFEVKNGPFVASRNPQPKPMILSGPVEVAR